MARRGRADAMPTQQEKSNEQNVTHEVFKTCVRKITAGFSVRRRVPPLAYEAYQKANAR